MIRHRNGGTPDHWPWSGVQLQAGSAGNLLRDCVHSMTDGTAIVNVGAEASAGAVAVLGYRHISARDLFRRGWQR